MSTPSTTTAAVPLGTAAAGLPGDPLARALALLRTATPNALDPDDRAVWDLQRAMLLADLGLPPVERPAGPRRLTP